MEEKNMALLGFIASATEYLKAHMGEDYKDLEDLSDIDLDSIKNELANNLGNSFDRSNKNARNLLSAGKTAFESYINKNEDNDLINEFDEIFNVDFRKANKEKDEKITNNLMKLLQGMNVEDDEIDEYARLIADNREELENPKLSINTEEASDIDDIFSELIDYENGVIKNDEPVVEVAPVEVEIKHEKVETKHEEIETKKEEIKPTPEKTIKVEETFVPAVEARAKKIVNSTAAKAEDVFETVDDVFEDIKASTNYQEEAQKVADDYVARLMNDLNSSDIAEKIEQNRQKDIEENRIYEEIKEVYPYLTDGFVRRVYELRYNFENDYEEGVKIVLLQRLKFVDIDGLRKFVEVVMQHDYLVNVDEDAMIVDVFKEYFNTEGLILSEIFGIANQGRLLTGEYEGYRVFVNDEEEEGE